MASLSDLMVQCAITQEYVPFGKCWVHGIAPPGEKDFVLLNEISCCSNSLWWFRYSFSRNRSVNSIDAGTRFFAFVIFFLTFGILVVHVFLSLRTGTYQ